MQWTVDLYYSFNVLWLWYEFLCNELKYRCLTSESLVTNHAVGFNSTVSTVLRTDLSDIILDQGHDKVQFRTLKSRCDINHKGRRKELD